MPVNFIRNCAVRFLSSITGREEIVTLTELLYVKLLNHLKNFSEEVSTERHAYTGAVKQSLSFTTEQRSRKPYNN